MMPLKNSMLVAIVRFLLQLSGSPWVLVLPWGEKVGPNIGPLGLSLLTAAGSLKLSLAPSCLMDKIEIFNLAFETLYNPASVSYVGLISPWHGQGWGYTLMQTQEEDSGIWRKKKLLMINRKVLPPDLLSLLDLKKAIEDIGALSPFYLDPHWCRHVKLSWLHIRV